MLEHAPFDADADRLRPHVDDALERHGVDRETWSTPTVEALLGVLRAPLGGGAPALDQVSRDRRLDELGFVLPIREDRPLRPATLAGVFAAHGSEPWHADYARRLGELGFPALSGFLKGYADLVFAHDGRWWLVDWKSNHLGDHPSDYAPPAVHAAMVHHHYVLQYHLLLGRAAPVPRGPVAELRPRHPPRWRAVRVPPRCGAVPIPRGWGSSRIDRRER